MLNRHYSDIPVKDLSSMTGVKGATARLLIARADGAPHFSMRMFELSEGGNTPRHSHEHEHLVYILEGEGELFCAGETSPIAAGHSVFVPPHEKHQFRNTGNSHLRFLCLVPNGDGVKDGLR